MADTSTARKAAAAKKKAAAKPAEPKPDPEPEAAKAPEPEAADEQLEDEPRYSLGSAPTVPGEVRQDYQLPEEWTLPTDGAWPAPLDRMPDLTGLAELRREFRPEFVSKLPKNMHDGPSSQCSVCHGYHKPASVHLDYVGHAAVTDRLLSVDPLWWWEPFALDPATSLPLLDYNSGGQPIGMWIKLHVAGRSMTGYGTSAPKPDAIKEIIGDAIRNAAMRLGVALSMWTKGELESLADHPEAELKAEAAPKPPARDQATGQPVVTKPQREALIAMFDDIEDDDARKVAKREWLAAMSLEDPRKLTQDRLRAATEWIENRVDEYRAEHATGETETGGAPTPSSEPQDDAPSGNRPTAPAAPEPEEAPPSPPEPADEPEAPAEAAQEAQEAPEEPEAAEMVAHGDDAPRDRSSVWTPGPGESSWDGEKETTPSGIEVFPCADYIAGINTLLDGAGEEAKAEFDAWLAARGWEGIDLAEWPQWALHYAFQQLMAVIEAALPS